MRGKTQIEPGAAFSGGRPPGAGCGPIIEASLIERERRDRLPERMPSTAPEMRS